ncbi:unnamed protein product [Linum trigynum]|uniref:Uncharacterized protein n=1 Tax=Linum trigynum TaxID=586398 RepID=A0AAV2E9C0_9ROSI
MESLKLSPSSSILPPSPSNGRVSKSPPIDVSLSPTSSSSAPSNLTAESTWVGSASFIVCVPTSLNHYCCWRQARLLKSEPPAITSLVSSARSPSEICFCILSPAVPPLLIASPEKRWCS